MKIGEHNSSDKVLYEIEALDGTNENGGGGGNNFRRPQTAAKSGWGEESDVGASTGSVRKGRRQAANMETREGAQESQEDIDDEKEEQKTGTYMSQNGVMVVIPDLAEVEDEEMIATVASPPSLKVNRVKTIRELDTDLASSGAFLNDLSFGGVDLSHLTAIALCPPELADEDDKHWDWDVLFTELAPEFAAVEQEAATPA
ncbi:intraflagellar transport protein 43-domain-containing protein [Chytridium lagenaria]|nr:intraflagellar transport protein 43-domain-containing protein [Chytridium lagenaria]